MLVLLRSALFNAFFFGFTALIAVLAVPLLLLPPAALRHTSRLWARGVLGGLRLLAGVRLRIEGAEYMPRDGAALLASKHQSAFDTIAWLALLPRPAYVLKAELLRIPLYGWHARHMGMIGVDRAGGAQAMRGMMRAARDAAARGAQIIIFPEGTRVPPGARRPLQPGVVALGAATGLPVIPVATNSGRHWGRRAFRKHPGEIVIRLLPPLPAGLPREALLSRLDAAIEDGQRGL